MRYIVGVLVYLISITGFSEQVTLIKAEESVTGGFNYWIPYTIPKDLPPYYQEGKILVSLHFMCSLETKIIRGEIVECTEYPRFSSYETRLKSYVTYKGSDKKIMERYFKDAGITDKEFILYPFEVKEPDEMPNITIDLYILRKEGYVKQGTYELDSFSYFYTVNFADKYKRLNPQSRFKKFINLF